MSQGLRQNNAPLLSERRAPDAAHQAVALFDVVLTGHSLPAVPLQHAAIQLARLLRIPPGTAQSLLSGRPSIVRAQLPLAPALRYQMALQRVGAESQVMPAAANEPRHSSAAKPAEQRHSPNAAPKAQGAASGHDISQSTLTPTPAAAQSVGTTTAQGNPAWWMPDPVSLPQPTLADESLAVLTAVWGMGWLLVSYGAAVLAVAGGTIWHAWQHAHWLSAGIPYIFPMTYVTLLSGGIAMLLVLLRPLLASPCEASHGTELLPQQAPALYDLAQRIANAVGAPAPRNIRLTWHTTVRVAPGAQPDSPILLIGLPVLAFLSLEELSVALVRAWAPLSTIRRSPLHHAATEMETFLRHAACGPDSWDSTVEAQLAGSRDGHALVMLLAAWLMRASRTVFLPGLKLARFAARRIRATESAKQDTLAARFTGEAAVASTTLKLRLLRDAEALTSKAALNLGIQQRPIRDLPRITVERAVRSGRLHRPEQAASTLVADFDALSMAATRDFYAAAGTLHRRASSRPFAG